MEQYAANCDPYGEPGTPSKESWETPTLVEYGTAEGLTKGAIVDAVPDTFGASF